MAQVHLIVEFQVRAGKEEEARKLFTVHQENGRKDVGNLSFDVYQDTEEPTKFYSKEAWESQDHIDQHDATEHHDEFLRRLSDLQAKEKTVHLVRLLE